MNTDFEVRALVVVMEDNKPSRFNVHQHITYILPVYHERWSIPISILEQGIVLWVLHSSVLVLWLSSLPLVRMIFRLRRTQNVHRFHQQWLEPWIHLPRPKFSSNALRRTQIRMDLKDCWQGSLLYFHQSLLAYDLDHIPSLLRAKGRIPSS